ncbi:MAG: site-2 protease family protein [Acidimicrobiales bacterium]
MVLAVAGIAWLISSGRVGPDALLFFAVLVPSVILHEVSHGVVALWFGDTTAKEAGRLTLNPIKHVDPFGTLILPAIMVLSTGSAFGYAKPVPVRPGRLRKPRGQSVLVSLAGPATNLVLVGFATIGLLALSPRPNGDRLVSDFVFGTLLERAGTVAACLFLFGLANVVLAVFNMIPLPPLDGSALIERLVPDRYLTQWYSMQKYSMMVLVVLFLFVPGFFAKLITPGIRLWLALL